MYYNCVPSTFSKYLDHFLHVSNIQIEYLKILWTVSLGGRGCAAISK